MSTTIPMAERSYYEADARERIDGLLDAGSFTEFVGPRRRLISPHLAQLDTPGAFDDGIVVGEGRLRGRHVLIAAQQGAFMGGGVGEVHGAKLTGLLERAAATMPDAVVLLLDTGGVRLHEANAGLIAISEIMRATLGARAAGVVDKYASSSSVEANTSLNGTALTMSKTLRICGCGCATSTLPCRVARALRALKMLRMPALEMYSRSARSSTRVVMGVASSGESASSRSWKVWVSRRPLRVTRWRVSCGGSI